MWKRGRLAYQTSSKPPIPWVIMAPSVLMTRLKWVRTAPLGLPVVPDVYMISAGSCSATWVSGATGSSRARSGRRSARPPTPPGRLLPRMTTPSSSGRAWRLAWTSPARCSSTMTSRAPESARMKPTSPATSRKLTGTTTAPRRHPAKMASTISMLLPISTASRSPGPRPRWAKDAASRLTRPSSSAIVRRSSRNTSATRSGYLWAIRASCWPWAMLLAASSEGVPVPADGRGGGAVLIAAPRSPPPPGPRPNR